MESDIILSSNDVIMWFIILESDPSPICEPEGQCSKFMDVIMKHYKLKNIKTLKLYTKVCIDSLENTKIHDKWAFPKLHKAWCEKVTSSG